MGASSARGSALLSEAGNAEAGNAGAGRAGDPGALEHLAHYLSLLGVLKEACELPALRFMEPTSLGAYADTVPVDLAFDLGASRTAALIAERHHARDKVAAGSITTWGLGLRHLANPGRVESGL